MLWAVAAGAKRPRTNVPVERSPAGIGGPTARDNERLGGRLLAGKLLAAARRRGVSLAVAEADTGGLVLSWLTAWPGSSAVVLGGVVAYADALKQGLVGVDAKLIAAHGAVSQPVVEAMAV